MPETSFIFPYSHRSRSRLPKTSWIPSSLMISIPLKNQEDSDYPRLRFWKKIVPNRRNLVFHQYHFSFFYNTQHRYRLEETKTLRFLPLRSVNEKYFFSFRTLFQQAQNNTQHRYRLEETKIPQSLSFRSVSEKYFLSHSSVLKGIRDFMGKSDTFYQNAGRRLIENIVHNSILPLHFVGNQPVVPTKKQTFNNLTISLVGAGSYASSHYINSFLPSVNEKYFFSFRTLFQQAQNNTQHRYRLEETKIPQSLSFRSVSEKYFLSHSSVLKGIRDFMGKSDTFYQNAGRRLIENIVHNSILPLHFVGNQPVVPTKKQTFNNLTISLVGAGSYASSHYINSFLPSVNEKYFFSFRTLFQQAQNNTQHRYRLEETKTLWFLPLRSVNEKYFFSFRTLFQQTQNKTQHRYRLEGSKISQSLSFRSVSEKYFLSHSSVLKGIRDFVGKINIANQNFVSSRRIHLQKNSPPVFLTEVNNIFVNSTMSFVGAKPYTSSFLPCLFLGIPEKTHLSETREILFPTKKLELLHSLIFSPKASQPMKVLPPEKIIEIKKSDPPSTSTFSWIGQSGREEMLRQLKHHLKEIEEEDRFAKGKLP
jgi:hypothetical protein